MCDLHGIVSITGYLKPGFWAWLMGLGSCSGPGSVDSHGRGSAVGPNSDEAATVDSGGKKAYCSLHIAFFASYGVD